MYTALTTKDVKEEIVSSFKSVNGRLRVVVALWPLDWGWNVLMLGGLSIGVNIRQ